MDPWTGTVDLGTQRVAFALTIDGDLQPDLLELLRWGQLGTEVMLTATGPPVTLTADDARATLAWLHDTYRVVAEQRPDGWGDDPRVAVPDDALA